MTKKITLGLIAIFAFSISAIAQDINWVTMEEALELQKKEPKKIFMDVYTNWCGPCKMLDKNTFHNKDVAAYVNEHFYAVKFNAEGNEEITYKDNTYTNPNYDASKANSRNGAHEFSRYLQIKAYPTMVFFDEEGNVIAPIQGYLKPQQLELYLKIFETDKYKEMTTQEQFSEYVKSFEAEFEE
ncbi:thioredoxin fold domain-containing protein [uncultured Winogradskyella sp.]|uniref:thioredoxin family protein n=1 Tax=uncultured Winogradskyella sp. TaxID=395353 RepID=UPI002619E4C1|nr:thioredoxin fold domain-containing protein [uncultured Winogradskyella sp.]|tara:strand:+ start:864 stop:1415 length:552 start_codon:yes stop_codon:yes gene_type:complete